MDTYGLAWSRTCYIAEGGLQCLVLLPPSLPNAGTTGMNHPAQLITSKLRKKRSRGLCGLFMCLTVNCRTDLSFRYSGAHP